MDYKNIMLNETGILIMARKKIRYTKDEIINNLYTTGGEYMTTNFQEYIGLYHKYTTGEVFTFPKWNPYKSIELIEYIDLNSDTKSYKVLKDDIKTKYQNIQSYRVQISQNDRKTGYITRYFAYNIVNKQLIEINKDTFKKIKSKDIDPNLYQIVSLRWFITGPVDDINDNGYVTQGVRTKNQDEKFKLQFTNNTRSIISIFKII